MKYVYQILKNIFAYLFSVHNAISLSCHEQVCLMRLRFERYFSHHRPNKRSFSRNVASLNILVHDVINLLYKIYQIFLIFKYLHFCHFCLKATFFLNTPCKLDRIFPKSAMQTKPNKISPEKEASTFSRLSRYLSLNIFLSISFSRYLSLDINLSISFSRYQSLDIFLSISFSRYQSLDIFLSISFSRCQSLDIFVSISFSRYLSGRLNP